jgi:hypothetical protein
MTFGGQVECWDMEKVFFLDSDLVDKDGILIDKINTKEIWYLVIEYEGAQILKVT